MPRTIIWMLLFMLHTPAIFAQNTQADVERIIEREMKERRIPGLQIAVVHKGRITLSKSYGIANIPDAIPVDNNTSFAINSCTKVFTGVAVMQLVEAGKVELSAPISRYLDSLPSSWQPITVRQLLAHISGLPDIVKLTSPFTNGLAGATEAEIWAKIKAQPMDGAVGEQTRYNQTNFVLLGMIIDKLSGQPFTSFFKEKQFQVAAMAHTDFADSRDVVPHFAPTYRYLQVVDGQRLKQARLVANYTEFPPFTRAAAGINSTATDIAKWIIALKQGKLFSKKGTLDTMWAVGTYNNGKPTPWALGWGHVKLRPKHKAIGMSGGGRSAFLVYPDDDLAVIVLTNLGGGAPEDYLEEIAGCYNPDILAADPITFLRANLRKQGYEKAIELVNKQKQKDPTFQPNENEVNDWSYRLMSSGKLKEALAIFKLNVTLYPDSWNVYDSYGEALMKDNQKTEAIRMYQKSIQLNPENENGKKILAQLQK